MNRNGFLFIDKEAGPSSRRVDNLLRRKRNRKHVGHLGTLDPFASGLFIVALGEGTKRLPFLKDEEKTYIAKLELGKNTDTRDCLGKVTEEKEVPSLSAELIRNTRKGRRGTYQQEIPSFSATHYEGKRRYDLAREGKKIPKRTKEVTIKERNLIGFDGKTIIFSAKVSKGTYIRTLGRDLAVELNTLGYLSYLRRIRIGERDIVKAKKIEQITEEDIIPIVELFPEIPQYQCKDETERKRAAHGNELWLSTIAERLFIRQGDVPLALYQKEGQKYVCVKGFNQ